ncbi:MAG: hypothetical protein AAF748_09525 [Pseudomonadota bacterium]
MARVIVVLLIFCVVVAAMLFLFFRFVRAVQRVDEGKGLDMAGDGMIPKLAYGILLALIVYATLTASGG